MLGPCEFLKYEQITIQIYTTTFKIFFMGNDNKVDRSNYKFPCQHQICVPSPPVGKCGPIHSF